MSENCIFCKIVRKEAAASIVYEDVQVMVFMDIRPVNEGHTLVISRKHYEGIFDAPEELVAYTHKIAKRIAIAVKKATNADGISIIQQNGRAANQDIFHLHVHVIPRFEGQNMLRFGELTLADREKLDTAAAKIMQHLT
jgi:histidine triad (HIT) family protein